MLGKVPNSSIKPSALGITSNSSTYGSTIPVVYGRTQGGLYLIWCANVRQGASGKKGKSGGKKGKGTPPTYIANADALIGTNPIAGILQCWDNNQAKLGLNFTSYTTSSGPETITIPDPLFYLLLGVTLTLPYDQTWNDYGAPGPTTASGNFELPLWNRAYSRPDPVHDYDYGATATHYYYWLPGSAPTIFFEHGANFSGQPLTFYYAQKLPHGNSVSGTTESGPTPLAALRLTFESELGTGPEYNTSAYRQQQILYPHYAGVGSANFDLGGSGVAPSIRLEMLGTYPVYPSGDADFADIVSDLFGRAQVQAGFAASTGFTQIQHALPCYDFPGTVFRKGFTDDAGSVFTLQYDQPNTAGAILLVAASHASGGGTLGISDTSGNTYHAIFPTASDFQVWWASARAAPAGNVVSIQNASGDFNAYISEIGGVDTFDGVATGAAAAPSLTSTNPAGTPAYLIAIQNFSDDSNPHVVNGILWTELIESGPRLLMSGRLVQNPGTYTFPVSGTPSETVLLSFKCANPPNYPKPLGSLLDTDSLLLTREQCRAAGLRGSLIMNSQKKASDWLQDLYTVMNAAPVWSGFHLKSIPYSEVSAAGNGGLYTAPTAAGPVAQLAAADFIAAAGEAPVSIQRTALADVPNLLQVQNPNRASDYNAVVTSQPEQGSIAVYSLRKDSPQTLDCIQDVAVARIVLGLLVRRQNYLRNTYKFKLKAKWKLLEPMDLVTLTDPQIGLNAVPVRLTSIEEDEQYQLSCEAQPFLYGVNAPLAVTTTMPSPFAPATQDSPANVNAPVFFEPPARLANGATQLWIALSDSDPNYGGCQVYVSTDGGTSYNALGTVSGSAVTGVTITDWPAAADPDTTHDLAVDLTESQGALASYQTIDEDTFVHPCYVAGGTASIPYELMTYAIATLTAPYRYTLSASAGNHLRRAVWAAPQTGLGSDHPAGSRFAFVGPGASGLFEFDLDARYIGLPLSFKFCAFNSFGNGLQSLSDVTAYAYTPTGVVVQSQPTSGSYSQTPANALANPTSTSITSQPVTVNFGSNRVTYSPRTFSIPAPSVPTTYYITVQDPSQLGDTASQTLPAFADTTQAHVGAPGWTYLGAITALPAGGGTAGQPGGWPAQNLFLINGQ